MKKLKMKKEQKKRKKKRLKGLRIRRRDKEVQAGWAGLLEASSILIASESREINYFIEDEE